jgi:septal ring factor EnvC (AmiA/AmiB activator)
MGADRSQVVEEAIAFFDTPDALASAYVLACEQRDKLARQLEQVEAERDEIQRQFDSLNWSSRNWTNALKEAKAERDRLQRELEELRAGD